MTAKRTSRGTPAHPTKDDPARRGRDGRKTAHDDDSTVTQSNPPNHGVPTHGISRFLWECDPETPVSELPRLYAEW